MTVTPVTLAKFREVEDLEYRGQPARAIVARRDYPTDRDDLWQALTAPTRLARWFLPISGELAPGGRFQLEGNAGGTIERCDPPRALAVTWEFGGNVSWVHVQLRAVETGTELTLKHILPKDDAAEEHWRQFGPGATGVGWDLSFIGLGQHLADGGAKLDAQAFEAWTLSDEGKAVVRTSAEAWGAAHVAGGEATGIAAAMAKRTGDFYTGE